jgi:vanillate O-demethylase ferredoxin subunit
MLRLRVRAVRHAAEGIRLFELVAQDHAALPPWTPGAHLRLHLQDGLVRAYSLCNAAAARPLRDCRQARERFARWFRLPA